MIEVSVSGNSAYNSIQAAVDAAIGNNPAPDLILIRDGVYDEKVTINSGNLRITGESFQRVLLKSALQIKGSGIELENLQNGENVIGRNDRRDIHALFLCGCLEAIPSGPPPFQHYIYNETISGGTVKGTVVLGHLGRVELFLRPETFWRSCAAGRKVTHTLIFAQETEGNSRSTLKCSTTQRWRTVRKCSSSIIQVCRNPTGQP